MYLDERKLRVNFIFYLNFPHGNIIIIDFKTPLISINKQQSLMSFKAT